MATLREIRRKIQSVDNIQKITQAMELVAASRFRKAQIKVESTRPYAAKLKEFFDRLLSVATDLQDPLISPRKVKKTGLVIIAGDRGLCGAYNQNVFNAAEKFLRKYDPNQVELILIGRKAIDYFEGKKWAVAFKLGDWGGKITHPEINALTQTLIDFYLKEQLDEIWLAYTHFINMTVREIRLEKFLNLEIKTSSSGPINDNYIFEPDPLTIFAELLPRYCTLKIQSALNEAYVSELAARISSMRAATKNAEEMKEKLTLIRNKVRQASITKELIEITSGAESLR
jgi:F-type H+-transporting ATPase subunit gamma